jgi:hypothetical protein
MHSPTKENTQVRIGENNKKIYVIKGRRKIKKEIDNYNPESISK